MVRRMNRLVVSLVLALTVPAAGCVPVAVGCVVAGSGSLIAAHGIYHDHCDSLHCAYRDMDAIMVGLVGAILLGVGAIDLAVRKNT
jgi:hypothetical protein